MRIDAIESHIVDVLIRLRLPPRHDRLALETARSGIVPQSSLDSSTRDTGAHAHIYRRVVSELSRRAAVPHLTALPRISRDWRDYPAVTSSLSDPQLRVVLARQAHALEERPRSRLRRRIAISGRNCAPRVLLSAGSKAESESERHGFVERDQRFPTLAAGRVR